MIGQSVLAAFFHSCKVGIPLGKTLGEGLFCRSEGNLSSVPKNFKKNIDKMLYKHYNENTY